MAENPEALVQLARLLGEPGRSFSSEGVQSAIEQRFSVLVENLVAEAAANDDVLDAASALDYFESRLAFLSPLLTEQQMSRLRSALRLKIDEW